jgi:nicotinate-nucleotide adenylyltransferase
MRIGVFGGTFDPVHYGHLVVADQAREQGRLDQVWFVLSARPPHKQELELTPFERRVEMLALALAGFERDFQINQMEKDRAGPSFTVDTLEQLATLHPEHEWFLILGADSMRDLPQWREPKRIISLSTLLIAERAGFPIGTAEELANTLELDRQQLRIEFVAVPIIDFSSRDIRQRIQEDRSIRFLVPKPVEVYIREKRLYRNT